MKEQINLKRITKDNIYYDPRESIGSSLHV